jgi:hypothetical protein
MKVLRQAWARPLHAEGWLFCLEAVKGREGKVVTLAATDAEYIDEILKNAVEQTALLKLREAFGGSAPG